MLAVTLLVVVLNMRSPAAGGAYKAALALELIILGLWIPPTYAIAGNLAASPRQSTVAALAFCGINLYVPNPVSWTPTNVDHKGHSAS